MSEQVSRKQGTGTAWIVAGIVVLVLGVAAFIRAMTVGDPSTAAGSFTSAVIVLAAGVVFLVLGFRKRGNRTR